VESGFTNGDAWPYYTCTSSSTNEGGLGCKTMTYDTPTASSSCNAGETATPNADCSNATKSSCVVTCSSVPPFTAHTAYSSSATYGAGSQFSYAVGGVTANVRVINPAY